jgi:anti-sigma B factor antagonist
MSDTAPHVLALEGDLTIQVAAERAPQLLAAAQAAAAEGADLALDLAAVQAFDSAGVQLLLALQRSLAELGRGLQIQPAGKAVTGVLQTYGLQGLLGSA